jgi:hypothetical protein
MPKKQQRPESQRGKTGESGVPPTQSAMDKFKSLARDLLKVSRDQLNEEQQKYASSRTASGKTKAKS